jgi:hypothetical protein
MKTTSLPIVSFLAALAAAIFLPIGATAACILLTVTGAAAILAVDYGREIQPLRVNASIVSFEPSAHKAVELNHAA